MQFQIGQQFNTRIDFHTWEIIRIENTPEGQNLIMKDVDDHIIEVWNAQVLRKDLKDGYVEIE